MFHKETHQHQEHVLGMLQLMVSKLTVTNMLPFIAVLEDVLDVTASITFFATDTTNNYTIIFNFLNNKTLKQTCCNLLNIGA